MEIYVIIGMCKIFWTLFSTTKSEECNTIELETCMKASWPQSGKLVRSAFLEKIIKYCNTVVC